MPAVADAVPTAGGFAVGRAVWMAVRLAYRAYLRRVVYLMAVVAALPSAFGVSSRWPLVTGRPQWQLLVFGGCPPFPWGNMPLPTVIVAVHSPSLPLTALGFCPHGSGILSRVSSPPPQFRSDCDANVRLGVRARRWPASHAAYASSFHTGVNGGRSKHGPVY